MANTAVKVSALPAATSLVGSSKIPVIDGADGNTKYVSVSALLGNTPANVAVRATRIINTVPSSSSSNGTSGDIGYDSNFVYVCVATNTWKRASLVSW